MVLKRIATCASCWAALLLGSNALAATFTLFNLPGHTNYSCYVGDQPTGTALHACGADTFQVQVFVVKDVSGAETACVAAMPYNMITIIYFGKKGTGTLKWTLPADSHWADPGVAISAPDIDTHEKTFKKDSGAISNQDFTVELRKGNDNPPNNKRQIVYQHRPVVYYQTSTMARGIDCAGVDPLIVNSEN